MMPRRIILLAGALAALAVAPATDARPVASAAKACGIRGVQRSLGPSYVTSLSVRGTSCATGKRVVRAYYRCRVRSGGVRGRCHRRVLGFRCSERRAGIPIQFDATVTCRRGRARVYHAYTQNT